MHHLVNTAKLTYSHKPLFAQGLVSLMYGVARLRLPTTGAWRARLLDAAWRRMPAHMPLPGSDRRPGATSSDGSASGGLGRQEWGRGKGREAVVFDAPGLAQLLWALVRVGKSPPHDWLAACLREVSWERRVQTCRLCVSAAVGLGLAGLGLAVRKGGRSCMRKPR